MINRDQAKLKDRRVTYNGDNRPWLNRAPDLTLTGQFTQSSALVSFTDDAGDPETAWVGFGALDLKNSKHQATIDTLTARKNELQNEIDGIETAIKALEAL